MPGHLDHEPPVVASDRRDTDSLDVAKMMRGAIVKNLKKSGEAPQESMS